MGEASPGDPESLRLAVGGADVTRVFAAARQLWGDRR